MGSNRRSVLKIGATSLFAGIAGCGGGGSGSDGDTVTGGSDGGGGTVTAAGSLGISNRSFCAARPDGFGGCEPQPDATYPPSATVWLYFEVDGIAAEVEGESYRMAFEQHLEVTGPEGGSVLSNTFEFTPEAGSTEQLDRLFVSNDVTLGSDPPTGDYEVAFEVTDLIAGASTTDSGTFAVA